MGVYVHVARGESFAFSSIILHFIFLRQNPSLNLELTNSARLAGQGRSRILLSLPSQYRITGRHSHAWLFSMDAGIQTEVLMFKRQVLYRLSHPTCPCYTVKALKRKHAVDGATEKTCGQCIGHCWWKFPARTRLQCWLTIVPVLLFLKDTVNPITYRSQGSWTK